MVCMGITPSLGTVQDNAFSVYANLASDCFEGGKLSYKKLKDNYGDSFAQYIVSSFRDITPAQLATQIRQTDSGGDILKSSGIIFDDAQSLARTTRLTEKNKENIFSKSQNGTSNPINLTHSQAPEGVGERFDMTV